MSFDRYYVGVPADQREELRAFRQAHPLRHTTANGTRWEYLASGQGEQVILLLVGGLRAADAAFRSILRLEPDFRVITPSYPALKTMGALADGLTGVLETEGVDRAHVLSGSFGGMLALALVQRHPARVAKLILSSTAVPGPDEVRAYRVMLRLMALLPSRLVLNQMRAQLQTIIDPPEESAVFWAAYLRELFGARLSKAEALSTLHCMVDFAETAPRTAADLAGWQGESLLLDSEDDHTFDESARGALRALLPGMQVHLFTDAGHSPAMTKPDEFFGVIRQFLKGSP